MLSRDNDAVQSKNSGGFDVYENINVFLRNLMSEVGCFICINFDSVQAR